MQGIGGAWQRRRRRPRRRSLSWWKGLGGFGFGGTWFLVRKIGSLRGFGKWGVYGFWWLCSREFRLGKKCCDGGGGYWLLTDLKWEEGTVYLCLVFFFIVFLGYVRATTPSRGGGGLTFDRFVVGRRDCESVIGFFFFFSLGYVRF